jgi:hypothetical protein
VPPEPATELPPRLHRTAPGQNPKDEVGSEFHWDAAALLGDAPGGSAAAGLPDRHALFATACGALTALLRRLAPRGRLHIPSYFCMGVAEALSADVPLAWYRHLPGEREPRLDTLRAVPGDVVLAQNLFGREEPEPWDTWQRAHPDVVVVEDHSHDPFSDWARRSSAPYAVASLRKTLPLPDGGLLWSPRGLELPQPTGGESPGAGLKLAAMLLKAAWLEGRAVAKDTFRTLQGQGEATLLGSTGPASAVTRAVLPLLDVARLRAASTRNAHAMEQLLAPGGREWTVLTGGPAGAAPFRVQLGCRSEAVRDALLAYLAQHRIYAPVHWRQDRGGLWSGDLAAADLASRMLTVPIDHRYGPDDVQRVAEVLLGYG